MTHHATELTFIDLFAGIGGMRRAISDEHSRCVFSSEWDTHAQKTYHANYGEQPHGDITQIEATDIPDHNLLLAGFPCQPFSNIGQRLGFNHATQGTLFFDIARILEAKRPQAFLLENVPGLQTIQQGATFKVVLETLQDLGYTVHHAVLNAADFGLPQVRKRLYIVGFFTSLRTDFHFPVAQMEPVFIGDYLEENATGYSISAHLQQSYLFKTPDGKPQVVDKTSKVQVKTLVASYHKIQRLTGTFVKGGETGLRLLSALECKRLQGFPDSFEFPVSRTQMYRQLGNSVAVPVVQAIGDAIKKCLREVNNYG